VVVQVPPDIGQVMHYVYPDGLQVGGTPDARREEEAG
jgi:hypothetical protein